MTGIAGLVHTVKLLHRWDSQLSTIPVALTCHFTPERGQSCICYTGCNYLSFYSTGGATKYLPYLLHLPVEARRKGVHPDTPVVPTCGFALQVG